MLGTKERWGAGEIHKQVDEALLTLEAVELHYSEEGHRK